MGPPPVDRGRPGSKQHLICDAGGIPLAVALTGGNRNDITQLIPLIARSRPSGAGADGPCASRGSCSPTAATTTTSTGGSFELAASRHASPAAASLTAPDWAGTAGSSNAGSPGYMRSSGSAPATNAEPTSTSVCCNWPAH